MSWKWIFTKEIQNYDSEHTTLENSMLISSTSPDPSVDTLRVSRKLLSEDNTVHSLSEKVFCIDEEDFTMTQ